MNADKLLVKAINTLNRWNEEADDIDDDIRQINKAQISILEYCLLHVENRKNPVVRNGIQLAYAILGVEEK